MIKFRKTIFTLALLLTIVGALSFNGNLKAEEISISDLPNSNKNIRFIIKDKPLSYALTKLARRAKMNILIASDFNDSNISINSNKISIGNAFETLMEIGDFVLEKNNNVILIKNAPHTNISTNVINVNNIPAEKLAYIIDKSVNISDTGKIDIDKYSNSLIIQGDEEYISQIQLMTTKLDLPKMHSTFKLNHYTSCQVVNILENMIFKKSESNNEQSSRFLAPVFDKNLGYVIKALIQKNDQIDINTEMPIIIPEETGNEITIIGNNHQIALVKELVEYLEGKKTDKDEEIRSAHNKIYQMKKELQETKSQLDESQLELADAVMNQVNTEVELKDAKAEISALNEELKQIKTDKSWNLFFNYSSNNQTNYIKELENEIANLRNDISKGKQILSNNSNSVAKENIKLNELSESNEKLTSLLNDRQKINDQLRNELQEKEEQLSIANDSLIEIKAKLAEIELKKNLMIDSNNNESEFALMASTLENLQQTKNELNKVKSQLEASKQQLELIFGGKLLDNETMPNDKSIWFN